MSFRCLRERELASEATKNDGKRRKTTETDTKPTWKRHATDRDSGWAGLRGVEALASFCAGALGAGCGVAREVVMF